MSSQTKPSSLLLLLFAFSLLSRFALRRFRLLFHPSTFLFGLFLLLVQSLSLLFLYQAVVALLALDLALQVPLGCLKANHTDLQLFCKFVKFNHEFLFLLFALVNFDLQRFLVTFQDEFVVVAPVFHFAGQIDQLSLLVFVVVLGFGDLAAKLRFLPLQSLNLGLPQHFIGVLQFRQPLVGVPLQVQEFPLQRVDLLLVLRNDAFSLLHLLKHVPRLRRLLLGFFPLKLNLVVEHFKLLCLPSDVHQFFVAQSFDVELGQGGELFDYFQLADVKVQVDFDQAVVQFAGRLQ